MAEKLSVQIELTGGAAVEQQLAGIGKAGSESFQETSKAADQASESVSKFSLQSVAAGASIARSFAGIATEAVKIGLAFKDQSLAAAAFEKLGAAALGLRGSLGLVAEALGPVGVSMALAATAAIAAAAAFETFRIAAEKMAKPFEDMNNRLQTLATNSGQSFASLQQGEAAFAQIGISAETFAGTITKIGEILQSFDIGAELQKSADETAAAINKVLEAEKALLELQTGGPRLFTLGDPAALDEYQAKLSRLREIQQQLSSETNKEAAAQSALAAARGKAAETAANSLKNVLELVQAIEAGQKGITFDSLTKSEAIIKAVAASLKMAAEDGKDANRVLLEFLAGADRATAVKVGAQFGFSEAQVDLIRRFANELGRLGPTFERVNAAGALIGPTASKSFQALTASIQNVNAASERLRQAWDSSFFARFAADAATAMNNTKAAVLDFAAATLEALNRLSAVQLIQLFSGVPGALQLAASALVQFAASFNVIASAAQSAGDWISRFAAALVGITWGQIMGAGVAAWNAIVGAVQGAAAAVQMFAAWLASITWGQIMGAGVAAWNAIVGAAQQAAAAVETFAAWLASVTWDAISGAGIAAWNALTGAIQNAGTVVTTFVSSLGSIVWDAISGAGVAAWNAITAAIENAIAALLRFIGLKARAPAAEGGGGGGFARGGWVGGRGTGTSDSNLAWVSRGEYIMPARAVAQPGVLAFLEALRRTGKLQGFARGGLIPSFQGGGQIGVETGPRRVLEALAPIIERVGRVIEGIADNSNDLVRSLDSMGRSLIQLGGAQQEKAIGFIGELIAAQKALLDIYPGKARGGLLGGRGTGTSDSNLAWLSRGEYITPARAVRQPGVLAFLEALRRSGGNLRAVLDGMGRFALGGLVPRPMPAFASGGLAGGMHNITISFPGVPPIGGLRASSAVVDELRKAAAMAQVRSGGRKPSRYS